MIENNWWELYRAAVLELDRNKRQARVKDAEGAIRARASACHGRLECLEKGPSLKAAR
jgi:hypothetical protein